MQKYLSRLRSWGQSYDWFVLALWVLLFMGVIVRVIKLPLMEFKGDEFHFLTQSFLHPFALGEIHGVRSPVPIPHPPSFAYFLAFPVSLTIDPIAVTATIVWANLIGLWLFYGFCRRLFAKDAALISTALLASMPWAVIFSRKIWNPDLVFPFQMLFLVGLENLVRAYNPWKLYLFVVLLVLFLQAHLLSLFSVIPVFIVLYIAKLPLKRSEYIRSIALFLGLFLPYLSYMFGYEGNETSSFVHTVFGSGMHIDVLLHNILWWAKTSTGLGFSYLLGESGYATFLDIYHMHWVPYVFGVYIVSAVVALLWILTKMLREIVWYSKKTYPPSILALLFLALWGVLLPAILTAANTVSAPHYWVSIIIVFPICFGVAMHALLHYLPQIGKNILRTGILIVIATQVLFMLLFYGFLEKHHEKITGDYGVPYIFEQSNWEQEIQNTANTL